MCGIDGDRERECVGVGVCGEREESLGTGKESMWVWVCVGKERGVVGDSGVVGDREREYAGVEDAGDRERECVGVGVCGGGKRKAEN